MQSYIYVCVEDSDQHEPSVLYPMPYNIMKMHPLKRKKKQFAVKLNVRESVYII